MALTPIIIYCDGACSPNPGTGGWGAVLISPGHGHQTKELSGAEANTTNNRMELTGAIRSLEALKRACAVTVFTDSKYLRNAFTQGWLANWQRNGWKTAAKQPVLNADLWRRLIELSAVHQIEWRWVAGHADSAENNRADELAVKARESLAAKLGFGRG